LVVWRLKVRMSRSIGLFCSMLLGVALSGT
jgi:hypothetical protein